MREAQELDSLSPAIRADVAWIRYMARQYSESIEASRHAADADPKSWLPYRFLGLASIELKDFDQAIKAFETANVLWPSTQNRAELAYAYALGGRRADATRILGELIAQRSKTYASPFTLALVAVGLGDLQVALDWLDTAKKERANLLVWAGVDPRLDPLRQEPRFLELLKTLRLQ